jgi:alkanesulfonate monooxygenase SsuD/methylene tetrahydromethanopterin reductase-like flavin-dependent oxidoreductase (luciferase family)
MTPNGMHYGVVLPGGTALEQLELGTLAEEAGWDGVFTWERHMAWSRGACWRPSLSARNAFGSAPC